MVLVEPKDLVDGLKGRGGEIFEVLVQRLVRAECRRHGIPDKEIDWDYRTNCPDGGCDIFIKTGHKDASRRFIPARPSLWSVKSGEDGTRASKLAEEIHLESHTRIRRHLKDGNTYVWCVLQPTDQGKREAMYLKRDELAVELDFDPELVVFVWNDALASLLEDHPCLVPEFLPELARRLHGTLTIDQWRRESPEGRGLAVDWVSLEGRDDLKRRIQEHLLAREGSPVLHIAGISGIGKTRSVLQACWDNDQLYNTLYAPDLAQLSDEFLRHIESKDVCVRVIIDEVGLDDFGHLAYRFRGVQERVRLVTIGPARRAERKRALDPMLFILDEPDAENGVRHVVANAASSLQPEVQQSIARVSGHDLRLALLLAFATQDNPDIRHIPVRNLDEVWRRVTNLFVDRVGTGQFADRYELLTSVIDVGWSAEFRAEIEYMAQHFGLNVDELDRTIQNAHECGLGVKTSRFFEAGPRNLAIWVFFDRLWPRLTATLDQFLEQMPTDRLRRRFIERCQEVPIDSRDEMLDRVASFFLKYLGPPVLSRLAEREQSRVFEAWAETDPDRGLAWLEHAVKSATDEDLSRFSGAPDGSGGWSGRRQIVWLCEHLACFSEHFWQCEAILFRLAQVETELSIGNNSRHTWREMYLPVLANTEVAFPERLEHLLERLRHADDQTLELIVSAALGALSTHITRMVPPRVVGGRVVPEQWEPRTVGELHRLVREAGRSFLAVASTLSPKLQRVVLELVIADLSKFLRLGLTEEARRFVDAVPGNAASIRGLRITLDELIYREELISKKDGVEPAHLRSLRLWRDAIQPTTPLERLVDITGRNTWNVRRKDSEGRLVDDDGETYSCIAESILSDLSIITSAEDWLDSSECLSGNYLGLQTGKLDKSLALMATVTMWLQKGRCAGFVVGYLSGVAAQKDGLPEEAQHLLDRNVVTQPSLVLSATIHADVCDRGFARIHSLIARASEDEILPVRSLAFGRWADFLAAQEKKALLETLAKLSEAGNQHALGITFDLLAGWTRIGAKELDPLLHSIAVRLLVAAQDAERRIDDHDWKIVVEKVMDFFPVDAAKILAETVVGFHRHNRARYAQELIQKLASPFPAEVMKELGAKMLDDEKGVIFHISVFRGLFEAVGVQTVREWVSANGELAARRVARHVASPYVSDDGNPIIPPVTDWLLAEFADNPKVFSEFCMGRHSFEVRVGHARDRRAAVMRLVEPFMKHERKWVRDWAKYELESFEQEVTWDDQIEDEHKRA